MRGRIGAAVLATAGLLAVALAADPDAAERQYRVARRLAAEGAPQAADALRAVIEADPGGALADDARTDLATLLGAPGSLGEVGRLTVEARDAAETLLREAAAGGGDRAAEARVRAALLRLEPLPGRNPAAARLELLAAATDPAAGPWALRARAAVAALDRADGRIDRARAAWQRIVVDAPDAAESRAARDGLARAAMYEGRFGEAAAWVADRPAGDAVLELAARGELRWAGAGGRWNAAGAATAAVSGLRGASGLAAAPDGGVAVADRKAGVVVSFDVSGAERGRWTIDDVEALAFDPGGRAWAANADSVYRLDPDGPARVAALATFGAPSAIAIDHGGTIHVLDRRGTRIGRIEPGALAPELTWDGGGARLVDLAWDGRRLVGADEKGGRLLAIGQDGTARPFGAGIAQRPSRIATDPAGEVAVLDDRADAVVLLGPEGTERDRLVLSATGVSRPAAVALGPDGSLAVLDGATGRVVRFP